MFREKNDMKILCTVFASIAFTISGQAQPTRPVPEPADTIVIAVVLGKNITAKEKENLNGLILGALFEKYAKDHNIAPTEDELDAFVKKTEELGKQEHARLERNSERLRKELNSSSISDRDRKEKESELQSIESMREVYGKAPENEEQRRREGRQMAQEIVKPWKVNKSLYEKYGGRVIFQQFGVEPLDAYRDFLKEQEKNRAFRILDKKYEAGFWRYFTNDAMHFFYPKDEGAKFLKTPWWMMEKPSEE